MFPWILILFVNYAQFTIARNIHVEHWSLYSTSEGDKLLPDPGCHFEQYPRFGGLWFDRRGNTVLCMSYAKLVLR